MADSHSDCGGCGAHRALGRALGRSVSPGGGSDRGVSPPSFSEGSESPKATPFCQPVTQRQKAPEVVGCGNVDSDRASWASEDSDGPVGVGETAGQSAASAVRGASVVQCVVVRSDSDSGGEKCASERGWTSTEESEESGTDGDWSGSDWSGRSGGVPVRNRGGELELGVTDEDRQNERDERRAQSSDAAPLGVSPPTTAGGCAHCLPPAPQPPRPAVRSDSALPRRCHFRRCLSDTQKLLAAVALWFAAHGALPHAALAPCY